MKKNICIKQKGFTLIEIMVSTSIFMIIMLVALGALISSSNAAKKSQALRSAMDNVNFALESMTRSLRMGSDYACVVGSVSIPASANADCSITGSGGSAIVFTPASHAPGSRDSAYTLTQRADNTYALQKCTPNCVDLVSTDVNIEKLTFFVSGSDITDNIQPSIYILIKGNVKVKGEDNPFAVQTLVSQRSGE